MSLINTTKSDIDKHHKCDLILVQKNIVNATRNFKTELLLRPSQVRRIFTYLRCVFIISYIKISVNDTKEISHLFVEWTFIE